MDENKRIEQYQGIMQAAKRVQVESSPFLKTRVMAAVDQLRVKDRSIFRWKIASGLLGAVATYMVVATFMTAEPTAKFLTAQLDRPVVVRIETEALKVLHADVTRAVVELPEGVYFESKKYPELASKRTVNLNLLAMGDQPYLPVLVRGKATGVKTLTVKFINADEEIVAERSVPVNFVNDSRGM